MNDGWLCDSILKTAARPSPMSTAPAFSPGPCSTRGPWSAASSDGRASSCSCSARTTSPRRCRARSATARGRARATMRSYSSAVRPWRSRRAGSMLIVRRSSTRRTARRERAQRPIRRARGRPRCRARLAGALRVRHQADDVARARCRCRRCCVDRPVRVGRARSTLGPPHRNSGRSRAAPVSSARASSGREVVAFAVRDREPQHLARRQARA